MDQPYLRATLPGNIAVAVPDSLELLTSYVLQEQHDWFEEEIRFVRRLLRPGMAAVDVGANYGVYTLTMAYAVGPTGRVLAIEPAASTARYLKTSIALNEFAQVQVLEVGLSNRSGHAEFFVSPNSELSSLSASSDESITREIIRLCTLDECDDEWRLPAIEFVKLDAEGEEARILEGGQSFFARHSPLVMFELKHGKRVNTELIDEFGRLGYATYRLIPGLQLLAPFSVETPPDPYQLNLFACKPDRTQELASRGLLAFGLAEAHAKGSSDGFLANLSRLPYAQAWIQSWQSEQPERRGAAQYAQALTEYFLAHAADAGPAARYRALERCWVGLLAAIEQQATFSRLQTIARVATEFGFRARAVEALSRLAQMFLAGHVDFSEPFLPVNSRFDTIEPGPAPQRWCLAAILEQRGKVSAFSSYHTRSASLPGLRMVRALGFGDDETNRRLELVQRRCLSR